MRFFENGINFNLHKNIALAVGVLLLFFSGCSSPTPPPLNNPNDPQSQAFVNPEATIVSGPQDNSSINFRQVQFEWQGNSVSVLYSFKLDTAQWSPWKTDSAVTYESLDDDVHVFQVKSQHKNGESESAIQQRTFTVDILRSPAFSIVPNLTRTTAGSSFTLFLHVKNIPSLLAFRTVLQYDPSAIAVQSVEPDSSLMMKNGGTIVNLTDLNASAGFVNVNLAIALGSPKGTSGTGQLLRLQCVALKSGETFMTILPDSTVVRDTTNSSTVMNDFAPGRIVVQ